MAAALPPRVVVSGGSGTIGGALVDRLRALGCSVVGWNARTREPRPGSLGAVDAVVHLAGPSSISPDMPANEALAGTCGVTHELLDGVGRTSARWIFASTALVYGERAEAFVDESAQTNPPTLYAALKLATETMFAGCSAADILRFPTVYSGASREETVLGTILRQAATGPRITLRDVSATRDLLHVDDVVEAIEVALRCSAPNGVRVSNVAGAEPHTIGEVARRAAIVAGWRPDEVVVEASSSPRNGRLVLDGRRFEGWSGWRAKTSLDEGLRQALRAMRERIHV